MVQTQRTKIHRLPPEERKLLITQACIDVISEKGFSATSTREIARRANVSLGTVVHHFGTKEEILVACMSHIIDIWIEGALRILVSGRSPINRLHRLIEWCLDDPETDRLWRVYMAFWHEAVFDDHTSSSILDGNESWDRAIAACIQEGIDRGELRGDKKYIAKVLSTLMYGAAIHIHGNLGRWSRRSAIELCKDYLDSFAPRPPSHDSTRTRA